MYRHLDLADAALLDIHHLESIVLIIYLLVHAWEITLDFQEQTCQGISITLYLLKLFIIYIQNIVDLDIRSTYPEVLKCIVENNYSRIPVYQDNTDNIRGVLYIKDLLPHLSKASNFRWQSLIRPPYFVPETKKIDDLLREFQDNKVHIAIVVDEVASP